MITDDTDVKMAIYRTIADSARVPSAENVAKSIGVPHDEVETAYQRLAAKRLLVLEPGAPDHIRMAPPFSGVPTQHTTRIGNRVWYANCAWDAFGIAAALHRDADIASMCPDCNEPLSFQIRGERPIGNAEVVHFAVPAAHWWDDIIHT